MQPASIISTTAAYIIIATKFF